MYRKSLYFAMDIKLLLKIKSVLKKTNLMLSSVTLSKVTYDFHLYETPRVGQSTGTA